MIVIQCLSQSLLWTMPTFDCHRHVGQKPFLIRQLNLLTYQGMSLAHILHLLYQFFGSTEGCQREDWISDHLVISLQQIYPCQALEICLQLTQCTVTLQEMAGPSFFPVGEYVLAQHI